jgi:hypothetical protein
VDGRPPPYPDPPVLVRESLRDYTYYPAQTISMSCGSRSNDHYFYPMRTETYPEIDRAEVLEKISGNVSTRPRKTPPVGKKRKRGEGGVKIDLRIKSQNDKMIWRPSLLSREEAWEIPMTLAERETYILIEVFWEKYGFAPSYEDLAYLRGLKGIGNIKRIVDKLVLMGAVKRIPGAKRSVRPVWKSFRNLD